MGLASFSLLVAAWVSSYFAGKSVSETYKVSERLSWKSTALLYTLLLGTFFVVNLMFELNDLTKVALVCVWCFLAALL